MHLYFKPLKLQLFRTIQLMHKFTSVKTQMVPKQLALLTEMWDFNSYRCPILVTEIFPIHFSTSSPSSSRCLICTSHCTIHREKLGHIKKNTTTKIHQPSKPVRSAVNNLYFPAISLFFHQWISGPTASDTVLCSIELGWYQGWNTGT